VPDFLRDNPSFMKLNNGSSLSLTKAALLASIGSFKAALTSLRAETGDQSHDFIKLASTRCSYVYPNYNCATVYNTPQQLADLESSLAKAESVVGASAPVTLATGTPGAADDVTVNPPKFFAGIDLRSMLPTTWNAGASGTLPGLFPDPTFGGVLVGPLAPVNRDANGDGSPDWVGSLRGSRVGL
jgi:hypothetical protein